MLNRVPAIEETVYHKRYGKGTVTYQDALWFYGVKFEHGEECIHDSELYDVPVDTEGKPIVEIVEPVEVNEVQTIADLVIMINFYQEEIVDHKRNINFLESLSTNKTKYEVDENNFQFESLDKEYLEKTLEIIKEEHDKLSEENDTISKEVDSDDFK